MVNAVNSDSRDLPGDERALFGISFTQMTMKSLGDKLLETPPVVGHVISVVTANVDHIVRLNESSALRQAYNNASYRTIDGKPLLFYAKLLGLPYHHITGADLVPYLLDRVRDESHRLFFVVADDHIKCALEKWALRRGLSTSAVKIEVAPPQFAKSRSYQSDLAALVREHNTSHLFVGIGCPQSEVWIDSYRRSLGSLYAFSVGAALSFYVGTARRAPYFLRFLGLEWAWRVAGEPQRLAKRYFVRSTSFIRILVRDLALRAFRNSELNLFYDVGRLEDVE